MRRVSIFGATGSVGQSTLDLIRRDRDAYRVVALTGGANIARLASDAREFGAELAVTADETRLGDLRTALAGSGVVPAWTRAPRRSTALPSDSAHSCTNQSESRRRRVEYGISTLIVAPLRAVAS